MNETKLIDFDCKTLSNVSFLIMKRVKYLQRRKPFVEHKRENEVDRLLLFNTQVLNAFSVVKNEHKTTLN